VTNHTWLYQQESVAEGNDVKILRDFDLKTDHMISARRQDIVIVDYKQRNRIIVDVAIPTDIIILYKPQKKCTVHKTNNKNYN